MPGGGPIPEEAALAAHRSVLTAREALAAEPEAGAEMKADLGRSLSAVASLLERTGRTDEAVSTYRRAEDLLATSDGSAPAPAPVRAALANCRSLLGSLLNSKGHPSDALVVLRQARADQDVPADIAVGSRRWKCERIRIEIQVWTARNKLSGEGRIPGGAYGVPAIAVVRRVVALVRKAEAADLADDYGEKRWKGIGITKGRCAVVVFTDRGPEIIRIISLRKADHEERKEYDEAITDGLETN